MLMKNLKYLTIILSTLLLVNSCDELFNECIEGNNNLEIEYRAVTNFTGITNTTAYDVRISYDSVQSLAIEADENLLEFIRTSVRGENLYIEIENNECLEPRNRIIFRIGVPYIESVELTGSGDIDVTGYNLKDLELYSTGSGNLDVSSIIANTVDVTLSGSGDITMSGKASSAEYVISGSGYIRADDFTVSDCYVSSSGSGDTYLRALGTLEIIISGSGDVIYYGDPELVPPVITGSGNVYHR